MSGQLGQAEGPSLQRASERRRALESGAIPFYRPLRRRSPPAARRAEPEAPEGRAEAATAAGAPSQAEGEEVECSGEEPYVAELADGMPESQTAERRARTERTARAVNDALKKGGLPLWTVQAPNPMFAGLKAIAENFYDSADTYTVLDMHRLSHLLPKGKLPCPACRCSDRVESRGPCFSSIRKCADLEGNHYATSYSYRCVGCPAAEGKSTVFYSHSPRLHQVLHELGLDVIVDAIPVIFTRKGGITKALFNLLLREHESNHPVQDIAAMLKEAQLRAHLNKQLWHYRFHQVLDTHHPSMPEVMRRRREDRASFSSYDDPAGAATKVIGTHGMTNLLKTFAADRTRFKEGCMASVDAGPDGIVSIDHTHWQTKYIRGGQGERMCTAVLNVSNSLHEHMLSLFVQSTANDEIRPGLIQMRDNIIASGGTLPRIFYVDNPPAMERLIKEIFGDDAIVKQDLYHVTDRYARLIPDNSSLKQPFLAAVSGALLVMFPADVEMMLPAWRQERGLQPNVAVDTSWADFKDRFNKHGGRWMTPPAQEAAEKLDAIFNSFFSMTDMKRDELFCSTQRQELQYQHAKVLECVRNGYVQDPLSTENMYYTDAKGNRRTKRGTSQLESQHRQQRADYPGTKMGVEGAHHAHVSGNFSRLTKIGPITRPETYKDYGCQDEYLKDQVNQAAKTIRIPPPFPMSRAPHPNVQYVGGLKTVPLAVFEAQQAQQPAQQAQQPSAQQAQQAQQQPAGQAEQPAAAGGLTEEQQARIAKNKAEALQRRAAWVQRSESHLRSSQPASQLPSEDAGSADFSGAVGSKRSGIALTPRTERLLRHKTDGGSHDASSERLGGSAGEVRGGSRRGKAASEERMRSFPLAETAPLHPSNTEEVSLFNLLLPDFTKRCGTCDYRGLAVKWNIMRQQLLGQGSGAYINAKEARHLKEYHECCKNLQATQLSLQTAVSQVQQQQQPVSSSAVSAAATMPALPQFSGMPMVVVVQQAAGGPAEREEKRTTKQGGKGTPSGCRGCRFFLMGAGAFPFVSTKNAHPHFCENKRTFDALSTTEQKRLQKTYDDYKEQQAAAAAAAAAQQPPAAATQQQAAVAATQQQPAVAATQQQ